MLNEQEIGSKTKEYKFQYSFCSLVTNLNQYENMLKSIKGAGFSTESSEVLYIDNSKENKFEAYGGIAHFLKFAQGRYIILCHQDFLFDHDKKEKLDKVLEELSEHDPLWLVAGNAGARGFKKKSGIVTHFGNKFENSKNFPFKVTSLDENFMVLNSENCPSISSDLKGFHLYGTELCSLASYLGKTCYVIGFHLSHLGAAAMGESFYSIKKQMIKKYAQKNRVQLIQTTCTRMVLVGGVFKSKLFNSKLFIFIFKELTKLKVLIGK